MITNAPELPQLEKTIKKVGFLNLKYTIYIYCSPYNFSFFRGSAEQVALDNNSNSKMELYL